MLFFRAFQSLSHIKLVTRSFEVYEVNVSNGLKVGCKCIIQGSNSELVNQLCRLYGQDRIILCEPQERFHSLMWIQPKVFDHLGVEL